MSYCYLVYHQGLLVACFAKLYEAQHHIAYHSKRHGWADEDTRIDRWYGDEYRGNAPKERS